MKIHHFQRYHEKETIPIANTLLLLSKLYSYSPDKFFKFLSYITDSKDQLLEPSFTLHSKGQYLMPVATLTQPSYRISIETKLNNLFVMPLLNYHFDVFSNEQYQILLTLGKTTLNPNILSELQNTLSQYNTANNKNIIHRDFTYSSLILLIRELLSGSDGLFNGILDDYQDYCLSEGLLDVKYPQ